MQRVLLLLLVPLLLGSEVRREPKPELRRFRLVLHVPDQSGIYFSAWGDGDVITDRDASDGAKVTYRRRLIWYDDCEWEASEKLTPVAADRYKYEYRETPVSCPAGARADVNSTTPRDGHVIVHPLHEDRPLTPLVAWARGWERRKGAP